MNIRTLCVKLVFANFLFYPAFAWSGGFQQGIKIHSVDSLDKKNQFEEHSTIQFTSLALETNRPALTQEQFITDVESQLRTFSKVLNRPHAATPHFKIFALFHSIATQAMTGFRWAEQLTLRYPPVHPLQEELRALQGAFMLFLKTPVRLCDHLFQVISVSRDVRQNDVQLIELIHPLLIDTQQLQLVPILTRLIATLNEGKEEERASKREELLSLFQNSLEILSQLISVVQPQQGEIRASQQELNENLMGYTFHEEGLRPPAPRGWLSRICGCFGVTTVIDPARGASSREIARIHAQLERLENLAELFSSQFLESQLQEINRQIIGLTQDAELKNDGQFVYSLEIQLPSSAILERGGGQDSSKEDWTSQRFTQSKIFSRSTTQ